jgi:DNA-binding CsgD family transcriptional regulator
VQLASEQLQLPDFWAARWLELEERARVLLTRGLRVLWRSDAAAALLGGAGPLLLRGGRLVGADRAGHAALLRCLEYAAADGCAHALLEPAADARHYVMTARVLDPAPDSPIGVIVRAPEEPVLPDVATVFGLTASERHVISLLLKGLNPGDIAEASSTSVLTVRTHIKRVYSKLGIHTKEQLFAKLYAFLA